MQIKNLNTGDPEELEKKFGTVAEYAEHAGMNFGTCRNYASIGKLVFREVEVPGTVPMFGQPMEKERLVDFEATDALLAETVRKPRKKAADAVNDPGNGTSAAAVELRKNFALARRRELELAQLEGLLVPAEEVKSAWVKVLATVKTGVLRIPDRASQQVAASSDLREVRTILERECEAVLKGIHDELVAAGL